MRILITGGLGFQGSHLAEYWANHGHHVSVLNTPSRRAVWLWEHVLRPVEAQGAALRPIWGSVMDADVVRKSVEGQELVAHMAAWTCPRASVENPDQAFEINAMGTFKVLNAVRQAGACLILASSCEVYGAPQPEDYEPYTLDTYCQTEETPLRPHTPYAAGKVAGDRLAHAYWYTYGVPVVVLRPCNVYGPRQRTGLDGGAVIPTLVRAFLTRTPPVLHGGGVQQRQWVHVRDVVRAYEAVRQRFDSVRGEVFNVVPRAPDGTHSIRDILGQLQGLFRTQGFGVDELLPHVVPARKGEVSQFRLAGGKFERDLGWVPTVAFQEGLAQYVMGALHGDEVEVWGQR